MTVAVQTGGTFSYKCTVGVSMWENEYVHLFWALPGDKCLPDPTEVSATAWLPLTELIAWQASPRRDQLAPWFALYLKQLRPQLLNWSQHASLTSDA